MRAEGAGFFVQQLRPRLRPLLEPWSGLIVTGAGECWALRGDHYVAWLDISEGNGVVFRGRAGVDLAEVLTELGRHHEASDVAASVRGLISAQSYDHLADRLASIGLA